MLLNPHEKHETRAIDIRALRDAQKPDFMGDKIPATATDGSVSWDRGALVPVEGRLVVINRRSHIANGYDCSPANCPYSQVSLDLLMSPDNIEVGSGVQCYAQALEENGNGSEYYGTAPAGTWSSEDTSVATVD